jgi:cell wall-associated NlpC family hydrolase
MPGKPWSQEVSISIQAPAPAQALQSQIFVGEVPPTNKAVAADDGPRQQPLAVQVVLQAPRSSAGTYGIPAMNAAEVNAVTDTAEITQRRCMQHGET